MQFQCQICCKMYSRERNLNDHIKNSHTINRPGSPVPAQTRAKSFSCLQCGKAFSTQTLVKIHGRVHTKDKPYRCELCNAQFGYSSSLRFHLKTVHTDDKPFECALCGKCFSSKALVKVHLRVHTGVKPYSCDKCDKTFGYLSSRNFHLRTVHGHEKPFECSVCNKSFASKTLVKVHYRVHTKDKPFNCPICSKSFGYQSSLNCHRLTCKGIGNEKGIPNEPLPPYHFVA